METLDGENSHISYLSHIAWMIGNYKSMSDDTKYDVLYGRVCEAMNRRIVKSPSLNLRTYPYESIYVPDLLVAIVALNDYAKVNDGKYGDTVNSWLKLAKTEWIDDKTCLLASFLEYSGDKLEEAQVKGSYSALNCYYLGLVDCDFGGKQYGLMKKYFFKSGVLSGMKEYTDHSPIYEEDIDAGIILFGLSPSGTAFAVGPATYYDDSATRKRLLRTAEIVGHTVGISRCHYLLANFALVGEAIMLAMRTSQNSNSIL